MTKLLKPTEVAERFDVHPNTVREWLSKGLLQSIRTPGGHYRIDPSAVEALLNGDVASPESEPPVEVAAA